MTEATLPKIAYVIAAWSGIRRQMDRVYKKNPAYYLERHLERLSTLKHSLSRVIIVWPFSAGECVRFGEFLSRSCVDFKAAPLTILFRNNHALSYGSWLHAYETFRDLFTHYLFVEDDYLLCVDNFDRELLSIMESTPGCEAVFASTNGCLDKYMSMSGKIISISDGLITSAALEKALPLLRKACSNTGIYTSRFQCDWSSAFFESGINLVDFSSKFKVKYRGNGVYTWVPDNDNPAILEAM